MAKSSGDAVGAGVRTLFEIGTVGSLSDAELLDRFATRTGEAAEAAFAALMERHGPMVLRVCRSVLGDPHDANDAFQAVFLVVARRARSIRVDGSLGPWLFRVAHRTALRARRADARRRKHEALATERTVLQAADVLPDDLGAAIHEEIDRLPGSCRAPVVLCLLEGLTHQQAAQRLRWPVGTVESRLARARTRLRRSLTRRGLAPSAAPLSANAWLGSPSSAALPSSLVESTIRAAVQFSSHGSTSAAMASTTAGSLAKGVLRMMLLAKLAPALVVSVLAGGLVMGTALVRPTTGPKSSEPEPSRRPTTVAAQSVEKSTPSAIAPARPDEDRFIDHQSYVIPAPYQAVAQLRARIDEEERIVPGVIVWSSLEEALIVSSSQILNSRPPSDGATSGLGPSNILVNLPLSPTKRDGHKGLVALEAATHVGEPVAYDFQRLVALIRTPTGGRRLRTAPIVPLGWKIDDKMQVTNVEFTKGYPCPAVTTTKVFNPRLDGMFGNEVYKGFECRFESQPERVAGALFTLDGFLAGVGSFSDHRVGSAIYAAPQSIHRLLEKAGLSHLFGNEDRGSLFGVDGAGGALPRTIGDVNATVSRPPGVGSEPNAPASRAAFDRIETLERRVEAMDRKLDQILENLGGGAGR